MAFTPATHTPFQWQDSPSTLTPLDAVNLNAAEADLVSFSQSVASAAYAQAMADTAALYQSGAYSATPGAVTTLAFTHALASTPTKAFVTPTNVNARGVAFYVTFGATTITLNFASALTAATVYAWSWRAEV